MVVIGRLDEDAMKMRVVAITMRGSDPVVRIDNRTYKTTRVRVNEIIKWCEKNGKQLRPYYADNPVIWYLVGGSRG